MQDLKSKFYTREEEADLCRRKSQGDTEARRLLIESVLPYAHKLARKYHNRTRVYLDDLICESHYAVVKAVDGFDAAKGRLTTYVHRTVVYQFSKYIKTVLPVVKYCGNYEHPMTRVRSSEADIYRAPDRPSHPFRPRHLRIVRKHAKSLPDLERKIIHLVLAPGRNIPNNEIANRLGISDSWVGVLKQRAIEKISEMVVAEKV